jgi:two-component system NtrC family sensor kinase
MNQQTAQLRRKTEYFRRKSRRNKVVWNTFLLQFIDRIARMDLKLPESQEWFVGEMNGLVDAAATALLVINDEQDELVVKGRNLDEPAWFYSIDPNADGLISKCLTSTSPVLINRGEAEPLILGEIPDLKISSILAVPLIFDGQRLGVLMMMNKLRGDFNSLDRELGCCLAAVAAHSIYKSCLLRKLNIINADLEANRWQLLNSRNTLRTLFDSLPTSIYIIDMDFRLCAVNLHRAQRTGQEPSELIGMRCYEALYGQADFCPDCKVFTTLSSGRSITRLKREWGHDSEPFEWEISSYPIYSKDERVVQAILLDQDITEKRRLEANLVQSEKLAAVGQLAAGIAHEINNPLTAILANAQMLRQELPPEDDKQELVELISRAGGRAAQVVRNLLDLARKEKYEYSLTDINETILKSIELLQHELVLKSIHLVFDPDLNLPRVKASKDHLESVWLNLITNSIDAIKNGNRVISITTSRSKNEVQVTIADSGEGIPPESINRIFEPFYTTKSAGSGTGLGLSVTHRIIQQHDGRILVDSQLSRGTQFTVCLPIS